MTPADVRIGRTVRDLHSFRDVVIISNAYQLRGVPFTFVFPADGPSLAEIRELDELEVIEET